MEDGIARRDVDAEGVIQALRRSQDILSDMSRTIDDFRGYFKNNKLLKEEVLAELIHANVRILEPTMVYHNIALKLLSQDCLVAATVRSGELSQVMLCLVNNVKEQIVERGITGGEITVAIELQSEFAVIRIGDNAGGIEEGFLSTIFDPYFTTKPGGIGLGLYLSDLIVRQGMRGRIEIKNGAEGSVFSVFIPRKAHRESLL